jgi:hypothetical protein
MRAKHNGNPPGSANTNRGFLLRGADLLPGGMVVDVTKGKLTQLYACSDREATEGWGVIRQLLELTLPRTFLQQLQSALEARLEARQSDARGR